MATIDLKDKINKYAIGVIGKDEIKTSNLHDCVACLIRGSRHFAVIHYHYKIDEGDQQCVRNAIEDLFNLHNEKYEDMLTEISAITSELRDHQGLVKRAEGNTQMIQDVLREKEMHPAREIKITYDGKPHKYSSNGRTGIRQNGNDKITLVV